jgi:hypothetical protein
LRRQVSDRAASLLGLQETASALCIAAVVGLGIICLMVVKPNLVASLAIIVVSALLGLACSAPSWQARAVAIPAEEIK